jgi:phospholipid transport system substrate-binding protein
MRLKDDQWLVYDVSIEQVSLVSNYRNSYGEIVSKEGFEGLMSRMEEKIRQLKAAPEQKNGGVVDEANVWGADGELP